MIELILKERTPIYDTLVRERLGQGLFVFPVLGIPTQPPKPTQLEQLLAEEDMS